MEMVRQPGEIPDEPIETGDFVWIEPGEAGGKKEVDMSDMVLMPKKLTVENGAKRLLMGEFEERIETCCERCRGEGAIFDLPDVEKTCPHCGGDGSYFEEIPVSWTTIKRIYDMAVEYLSQPAI